MLGWSQLEETARSGVWLFRSALRGENLLSSLRAARDWVKKGSYHTARSVPALKLSSTGAFHCQKTVKTMQNEWKKWKGLKGFERRQRFFPEQNSTASFPEQIVDIPVRSRGLQGFHPRQSSSAFAAQSVDIPVPVEFLTLIPGRQPHSQLREMRRFKCFFSSLFPDFKKVRTLAGRWLLEPSRTRAHGRRGLKSQRSPCWRRSWRRVILTVCAMSSAACACSWRHSLLDRPRPGRWHLVGRAWLGLFGSWTWGAAASSWLLEVSVVLASASLWSTSYSEASRAAACGSWAGCRRHVTPRRLSEEFPFLGFLLALFALGSLVHYFFMSSHLGVTRPVSGCCMWKTENWILWEILRLLVRNAWIDSGYMFCFSTWRFWTKFALFVSIPSFQHVKECTLHRHCTLTSFLLCLLFCFLLSTDRCSSVVQYSVWPLHVHTSSGSNRPLVFNHVCRNNCHLHDITHGFVDTSVDFLHFLRWNGLGS